MRARRAGTVAVGQFPPTRARRGWAQWYRALPRAQPGPERSGGTRPDPRFEQFASRGEVERLDEAVMTMAGDGIVLDYNNMLSPRLGGDHGIDPAALDAMAGRFREAHADAARRRASGELGFYGLVDE